MKLEICEFFKSLIDPEFEDLKNEFLDIVYLHDLPVFIEYLTKTIDINAIPLVLEIIIQYAGASEYRSTQLFIREQHLKELMPLFSSKSKSLRLSMLKLLKTLISHNNEEINQYITINDFLDPLFHIIETNRKDNLLLSASFDIINVIITADMRTLIRYAIKKYSTIIMEGYHKEAPIIHKLREKYELIQSLDKETASATAVREITIGGNEEDKEGEYLSKRMKPEDSMEEVSKSPEFNDLENEAIEEIKKKKYDDSN